MTTRRKPVHVAEDTDPAADPSAPPAPAAAPLDAPPPAARIQEAAPDGLTTGVVSPVQTGVLLAESNIQNGLTLIVVDAATGKPVTDTDGLFEADPPYGTQVRCLRRLTKRITAGGRSSDYLLLPLGARIPGEEADRITALIHAQNA